MSAVPPSLRDVLRRSRDAGHLGPGDVDAHVGHAEVYVGAVPAPAAFLDLGSGGGVPGLVLALRWASATGVLLDAQERRVRFLEDALESLSLGDRVVAVHGRAEDLARDPAYRERFEVVTARSFGPPAMTAECGAGFLRPDGTLLVAEPPDALGRWPDDGLDALGLFDDGVVTTSAGTIRRLRRVGTPVDAVPRRVAAMRRRPAF